MTEAKASIDGKYQIVRKLGEGGMGAVYEAKHTGTLRRVAVKVIVGESVKKGAEVIDRFQREARATGAIESQHIAMVLDTGTDDGDPYLVMEYLSGEDLAAAIARLGPIEPTTVKRIIAQAAMGLMKAHEAGVTHRDIKPANLFLAERDGDIVVKLLDFGIAKIRVDVTSSENRELTKTGAVLGSPLYMSPEQARGDKTLDHRTDLWSLGVVMYEALTGRTPHGDVDTIGGLILAICSKSAPHIQNVAPWVDARTAEIVHKALALDPNDRFQSAEEMLGALRAELPSGTSLNASMLTAVSVEAKSKVESKIDIGLAATAPLHSSPALAQSGARTTGGVSNPAIAPASSSSSRYVVGGAVVALIVGGVIYMSVNKSSASSVTSHAATAAIETSAAMSANAAPSATSIVAVLVPPSATVQVDGVAAPSKDGLVMISGALGSTHSVRVAVGTIEITREVAITQSGAVPARIDLAPASSQTATSAKAHVPATTTAVAAPTFDRKFQ